MKASMGSSDGRASSIDLEILRTRFLACADELAAALANSASTTELSQSRELAVAIADAQGHIVSTDDPQRLGTFAATVAHVVDYFEFDLEDGDVILTNDPYTGAAGVQYPILISPLIVGGQVTLFVAVMVRINDMGGQVSGNLNPAATELLSEGVPVTPVKIERRGRPVKDIMGVFLLNGRREDETRRTIEAAKAAIALGHGRLGDLVGKHGLDLINEALAYAQDYSETIARAAFPSWQAGTYEVEREVQTNDAAACAVVRLVATVGQDSLRLDFTASDDQVPFFVNCSKGVAVSSALSAFLMALSGGAPANGGLLRVVNVVTRPGSVVHATAPAPCGYGSIHCGSEIVDVVTEALSLAAGRSLPVLSVPRPLVLSRPTTDRSGQRDLGRWAVGGASAMEGSDAWGAPNLSTRAELLSIEQWETDGRFPVEQVEYVVDSAGAGEWTGAPGVELVLSIPPGQLMTLWTVPTRSTVEGVAGGHAGANGAVSICTDGRWEPAPDVETEWPCDADFLRLQLAGGAGYGDPRRRPRASVIADLADGLLSEARARDIYDVSDDNAHGSRQAHG